MNVLVLIRELDQTVLEREIRNGDVHGDIITFYNETGSNYDLLIDEDEYPNVVQVCIIVKDFNYYAYIQHGKNTDFTKINVDEIGEISLSQSN